MQTSRFHCCCCWHCLFICHIDLNINNACRPACDSFVTCYITIIIVTLLLYAEHQVSHGCDTCCYMCIIYCCVFRLISKQINKQIVFVVLCLFVFFIWKARFFLFFFQIFIKKTKYVKGTNDILQRCRWCYRPLVIEFAFTFSCI